MAPLYHVWILDDRPENLTMIMQSFPADVVAFLNIQTFGHAQQFLTRFDELLENEPDQLPQIILLDFFLDRTYGTEILDYVLAGCKKQRIQQPIIIAHSSMKEANALLVRKGADFSLPKVKGEAISEAVAATFCSREALEWLIQYRRPLATNTE